MDIFSPLMTKERCLEFKGLKIFNYLKVLSRSGIEIVWILKIDVQAYTSTMRAGVVDQSLRVVNGKVPLGFVSL